LVEQLLIEDKPWPFFFISYPLPATLVLIKQNSFTYIGVVLNRD